MASEIALLHRLRRPVCPAVRLTDGRVFCGASHFDRVMMRQALDAGVDALEFVGCVLGFLDQNSDFMTEDEAQEARELIQQARLRARQKREGSATEAANQIESAPDPVVQISQESPVMAFKPFVKQKYPPRQWGLVGFAGTGKSTFLAQLRQPLLVIDADGRFNEVADLCKGPLVLSDSPNDSRDGLAIAKALHSEDLTGVGTVVLDSITPILRLTIAMAMEGNSRGENKNKAAAFQEKANQLRLIQDSMVRPGVDSVIVWHYEKGRDENGKEQKNQTVSRTEGERLMRSLNVVIELAKDESTHQRYAKVVWSRVGKKGIVIPDTEGFWKGVPARIEAALYDEPANVVPMQAAG